MVKFIKPTTGIGWNITRNGLVPTKGAQPTFTSLFGKSVPVTPITDAAPSASPANPIGIVAEPEVIAEAVVGDAASSPQNALNLARQLTSEEQLAQALQGKGTPLIGAGTDRVLLAAERLAAEYGGIAADWVKMSSESSAVHGVEMPNGGNFETHWYQNIRTGQVVEIKTKISGH